MIKPKQHMRGVIQGLLIVLTFICLRDVLGAPPTMSKPIMRRLNRVEYERTIRDLLGIEIDVQELLPSDSSANGFDNNADALHTSSFLMERYLEAADIALNLAIANRPQPPLIQKRIRFHDERVVKVATEKVFRSLDDSLVMFSSSQWNAVVSSQFYPPDRGRYRFRISARGFQSNGKPVTFRVDAGPMLMGTKNHLVGYFDVAPDKSTVIEFVDHLEARSSFRVLPHGLANAQTVNKIGADVYDGPGLAVEWVEIEGPLHDAWPPECHRRIFGDLAQEPAPIRDFRNRVEVASKDPLSDARTILRNFARRAYRRAVTERDVEPLVSLFRQKHEGTNGEEKGSFEQSIRVALKAALVSSDFLFRYESADKLNDYSLASRLSYFLWSTMPDDELLQLAEQGRLNQHGELRKQVERMLKSPKAAAFTENFVGQWLGLRDIDFTEPDRRLYPEFDDLLKAAMVRESHLFFEELLKSNLSVTNVVASDFTMLNERLAQHYGVPGVEGHAFRKVKLPPDSHRGGIMTMASVLKVTANGTNTSPVVRGAWVLDRVLGMPLEPPPPGVPAVEPDIRGATTIREQLAKHRQIESCAACHVEIDPPGFALESFDVIGGWRDYYRSVGNGKPVTIDGKRMPYLQGKSVDPSDVLPDGRKFRDIDELKQLLLTDKEQIVRAFATRLLTYSLGRSPEPAVRSEIDSLVKATADRNYGLRSVLNAVIESEAFRGQRN